VHKIKLGSDNRLRWRHFTNKETGAKIASGTVTAKLYDDKEVGGPTQLGATITITNEDATNGHWAGVIKDDHADLVEGMIVRIVVTADGGTDLLRVKPELAIVELVE